MSKRKKQHVIVYDRRADTQDIAAWLNQEIAAGWLVFQVENFDNGDMLVILEKELDNRGPE